MSNTHSVSSEPDSSGIDVGGAANGIDVTGVRRAFGSVYAVRDVSFTATAGTVTALIGPNGSGKTTLMLMLASLLRPDAGSIRIAGHDPLTATAAVRKAVGWMPDVLGSWASLSVRSTLQTTGRLYRLDRAAAAARAAELITLVGLTELADQPTRVLSRGQKQRLSLARALVHDPQVLLLDEPASGLDPVARIELRQLVRRVAAEGKTVLVSSHVLAELDEMADAAVYIEHGVTASAERVAGAKRTARAWRIRSSDVVGLEHALLSIGVAQAEITRDRAELVVAVGSETAAAELLRRIVASGVPVSVFAPAVGDLEHTFLDLSRSAASTVSVTRVAPASAAPIDAAPIGAATAPAPIEGDAL